MPTYTYECVKCGEQQEVFHGFSEQPKVVCAHCGSKRSNRLLGRGAGIIFKGSGFYETDFKNKGKPSGGDSKPATEAKPEAAKTETKSEPKKSDTSGSSTTTSKSATTAAS